MDQVTACDITVVHWPDDEETFLAAPLEQCSNLAQDHKEKDLHCAGKTYLIHFKDSFKLGSNFLYL